MTIPPLLVLGVPHGTQKGAHQPSDLRATGVLDRFAYDLKTGYHYGERSTGSAVRPGVESGIGVHNLFIDGPGRRCWGRTWSGSTTSGAIPQTRSPATSVEISNPSGWRVGQTEPIRTAMFAGNAFEMLRDIGGLGKR